LIEVCWTWIRIHIIVDIGAQKTTVCCIEDGMCFEESRVNLKFGGYDVTETFMKMMLYDHFNYSDLNLMRRHDFLLAEELKAKHTSLHDDNITVQLHDFHLRAHGQETRKYQFKIYDEGYLAPQVSKFLACHIRQLADCIIGLLQAGNLRHLREARWPTEANRTLCRPV
jgi:hypothetical protein